MLHRVDLPECFVRASIKQSAKPAKFLAIPTSTFDSDPGLACDPTQAVAAADRPVKGNSSPPEDCAVEVAPVEVRF